MAVSDFLDMDCRQCHTKKKREYCRKAVLLAAGKIAPTANRGLDWIGQ
jgi:hypothetical protein